MQHQLEVEFECRSDPAKFKARCAEATKATRAAEAAERKKHRDKKQAVRPRSLTKRDSEMLTKLGATKFADWDGHPPGFVASVRSAVKQLSLSLREAKTVSAVLTALKRATGALNRLDAKHGALMTPDVEEVVEVLIGLCVAAGVDEAFAAERVDALREF